MSPKKFIGVRFETPAQEAAQVSLHILALRGALIPLMENQQLHLTEPCLKVQRLNSYNSNNSFSCPKTKVIIKMKGHSFFILKC